MKEQQLFAERKLRYTSIDPKTGEMTLEKRKKRIKELKDELTEAKMKAVELEQEALTLKAQNKEFKERSEIREMQAQQVFQKSQAKTNLFKVELEFKNDELHFLKAENNHLTKMLAEKEV